MRAKCAHRGLDKVRLILGDPDAIIWGRTKQTEQKRLSRRQFLPALLRPSPLGLRGCIYLLWRERQSTHQRER